MVDILRLTVRDPAGGDWEHELKEALRQMDGVVGVTASYKANLLGITFDTSKVTPAALRARVEALGYDVVTCG
ncbi:MAG: heavy-metal-associated domain-containing protein [Acidobacteria bacterium]|nr:heavy-metal-associated domain-containing protein [Acidobacteriota bacterium]